MRARLVLLCCALALLVAGQGPNDRLYFGHIEFAGTVCDASVAQANEIFTRQDTCVYHERSGTFYRGSCDLAGNLNLMTSCPTSLCVPSQCVSSTQLNAQTCTDESVLFGRLVSGNATHMVGSFTCLAPGWETRVTAMPFSSRLSNRASCPAIGADRHLALSCFTGQEDASQTGIIKSRCGPNGVVQFMTNCNVGCSNCTQTAAGEGGFWMDATAVCKLGQDRTQAGAAVSWAEISRCGVIAAGSVLAPSILHVALSTAFATGLMFLLAW